MFYEICRNSNSMQKEKNYYVLYNNIITINFNKNIIFKLHNSELTNYTLEKLKIISKSAPNQALNLDQKRVN